MNRCIEQTINWQQKCRGGIKGYSTSTGTIQRWVFTSHTAAKCIDKLETLIGIEEKLSVTKDIGKSRIGFDEKAVLRTNALLKSWGNPFEHSLTLTNIASGVVASPVVQEDLLHAHKMGTAALESFISNRLESNAVSFYDPIKRLNLKAFAEMKSKSYAN